jgi:hypothetical protein
MFHRLAGHSSHSIVLTGGGISLARSCYILATGRITKGRSRYSREIPVIINTIASCGSSRIAGRKHNKVLTL